MTLLLDGKTLSSKINEETKKKIEESVKLHGRKPGLATIIVGDDPASKMYVDMKIKTCMNIGINSTHTNLSASVNKSDIIKKIQTLNEDPNIDGILLQLPLPDKFKNDTNEIVQYISPEKDVDGFLPNSMGLIMMGDETFGTCTPKGMIRLLERNDISIEGKEVVIVNRTTVIGKPLTMMFIKRNATVTVCHSKTKNLDAHLKRADIIAIGVGKVNFLTADKIKEGVVVLDAGINKNKEGKTVGDADFEGIKNKCSAITPVPGGIGPMTIAMLMENTYLSYMKRIERNN